MRLAGRALAWGSSVLPIRHLLAKQAIDASLKDAAARKGIHYGSVCDTHFTSAPAGYTDLFLRQCALCAADIWAPMFNPAAGRFNFQNPETADIDFATSHGLPLTGAHLLWFYHLPPWFEGISDRAGAVTAMTDYVRSVAGHFEGKVYSWNVVNEAINPADGQRFGMRRCWPLAAIGPDYFDLAFHAARLADPKALLIYNDFDMELDTPEQAMRRGSLLLLIDELKRRGTPIDGVGLQSHLRLAAFSRFDEQIYRTFLGEIASRGLKIIITELDVLDVGAPSDIGRRDQAVAAVYRRFLSAALDERAATAVVTWGLSDGYTWLKPQNNAAFVRPDGLPTRPLPFDDQLKPTAAFYAMIDAFAAAPQR
jgi:endo-1,4-beta-xylanase